LNVESKELAAFDQDDVKALQSLADLTIVGLNNVDRALELGLAHTVSVMGLWGADLSHSANREVETIRGIVWDLDEYPHLGADTKRRLQEIDACAERLRVPPLPERIPQPGDPIDFLEAPILDEAIKEIVKTMRDELDQAQREIKIRVELNCPNRVAIHPLWLSKPIFHLLMNAKRAIVNTDQDGCITMRTSVENNMAQVTIRDTGGGMPQHLVPLLFNQIIEHENGHQGKGLLLARFLLELHGGSAWIVWNKVGVGACFAFTVPLASDLMPRGEE
jgi:signal transduction histidine kinase